VPDWLTQKLRKALSPPTAAESGGLERSRRTWLRRALQNGGLHVFLLPEPTGANGTASQAKLRGPCVSGARDAAQSRDPSLVVTMIGPSLRWRADLCYRQGTGGGTLCRHRLNLRTAVRISLSDPHCSEHRTYAGLHTQTNTPSSNHTRKQTHTHARKQARERAPSQARTHSRMLALKLVYRARKQAHTQAANK
jgi:hypothetical protein